MTSRFGTRIEGARSDVRRHRARAAIATLALLLGATGCPPADQKASPSSGCTKVGQTCEVSTGKLGTCVQKDDCGDPAGCFLCQSQH